MGEVKLKRVTPKVVPPLPKEESTFENELLAKLRRRQESIDQPAPPTSLEVTQDNQEPSPIPTQSEVTPTQPEPAVTPPQPTVSN